MDAVLNDPKEDSDQKQAMISGLQRIELQKVFLLLTPDQRDTFRKQIMENRGAKAPNSSSK